MVWRDPRSIHEYGILAKQLKQKDVYMNEKMEQFCQSKLNPDLSHTNPVIPTSDFTVLQVFHFIAARENNTKV